MLCFREPRSSLVLFVSRYARSSLSHKNKIKIKMGRKFMLCWAAPFCSLSEWFLPHSPVLSCGLKLRVEWEWSQVGFVLFIPCRPWFSPFTAFPPQNGAMDALFFFFIKGHDIGTTLCAFCNIWIESRDVRASVLSASHVRIWFTYFFLFTLRNIDMLVRSHIEIISVRSGRDYWKNFHRPY